MKKTITIILLLIINISYAQLQRLDSLMNPSETFKVVFNYDNNGNCLSTISQFRNSTNDNWEGANGLELSYNNNQIISIINREENYRNKTVFTYTNNVKTNADKFGYDWNDNQWLQTGTILYTYNSDGLILEEVGDYDDVIASDGETLSFNGSNKYEYMYNSSNQNTSKKFFEKNSTTNNQWVLRSEKIYTYNSDGLLLSVIYTNQYNSEQEKYEMTYDSNNNLKEKIYSRLNTTTTNSWDYNSKIIYTYDNSIAVNDLLLPNSYVLNEYFEYYNFNNKPTVLSSYQWNNDANGWDDEGILNYIYTDTALNTNNINVLNYTVYPNPTTNQVKFDIADFEKIEIYDITGKLITKTKTNIVNMENVPNGTYLYRIQKGNETINGKIIKK